MAAFLFLCIVHTGCAHRGPSPTTQAIADPDFVPEYVESVDARAVIPVGWHPDPLKSSQAHKHQVWISPTGRTAYGIIHFTLPLPIGHELALLGFLDNMQHAEGEVTLISQQWDPNIEALRFVASGGLYMVRTNLFVRGFEGWAIYAGTLRNQPIETSELALAEKARERTQIGH